MARLTRFTQKLFGSGASTNQMAEFGSLAAGTPQLYSGTTITPEIIQALTQYTNGWFSAVIAQNSPAIEDMNALHYLYAYQIAYMLQLGIPEWDSGTTYYTGSFATDGAGNLYYSLTNSNLNNALTNNTFWKTFSGGSSGSSSSGIEAAEQKAENEHYSIITDPLDNSITSGFNNQPATYYNQGILLQSSTGTASAIVWSPVVLNTAAKDTTSTTNWSNVSGTTTLTTSATTQVGATSVSFTKTATGLASIKYDYGSLNFGVPNNTRLWFWINLANLTSFQSVNITISNDASTYGTNYQTWTLTTNYASVAIATGWNLCFLDVSTGGTPTGTGWNSTLAARFFTIGINTTSATSTVILINGIYFSYNQPAQYVPLGSELSVFDGTHRENFQVDVSNSRSDGPITLTNTLANTYAGGFAGASVYRSTMTIGNNQALMGANDPNGNSLAGAVTLFQTTRLSRVLRTALNSNNTLTASATVNTSQSYSIASTTTNVIVVNDTVNQIANLLIGDIVHVFSTTYSDGTANFIYLGDFTLTSNATSTGGLTTLTGTGGVPVGTSAGGYAVKKNLTSSLSVTASTGVNENFSTLTPIASPDGIILMANGIPYPYPQNVYSHWTLGNPQGTKNLYGAAPSLSVIGSLTMSNAFKFGQLAASGWSTSNYLNINQAATPIDGSTSSKFTISVWYYNTNAGTTKYVCDYSNDASTGWSLTKNSSEQFNISINTGSVNISSGIITSNAWHHVVVNYNAGAAAGLQLYVDGILTNSTTGTISATVGTLHIGSNNGVSQTLAAADLVADVITWSGVNLSQSQIQQIYNSGVGTPVGQGPLLKYRYQATSIAGQRLTYKTTLTTDTIAVLPFLSEMSIIKTG